MRRAGRFLAPKLGALLLALGIGFAIGPWHQPATPPVASKGQPAAIPTALKREPADRRIAPASMLTTTTPAAPVFAIKCRPRLASCRRWIALQEQKGRQLVRSAER
jgi:hypothetical protein